ncbi:MAG: hypothetical protein DRJ96_03870 [Thermoprotei archaeon]|nr:hypothetical protein [Deltaproteobacteria bacterium]RLE85891.1 MAG: hypothetical protein DRJ67_08265 [Thermoprotei archaeon]RLE97460.1 MAG: hypothetical protein DRJ96_03870 [Thermoprotei archaeon]
MNKVDREVDRAIKEVTPLLTELSKKLEKIDNNEVKAATLIYIILRLLGVSKIPHGLAIGSLEVCKAFVLSMAVQQMMTPDARELKYIA